MMTRLEASIKQYTDLLEKSMSLKFAIEGVLKDKLMQTKAVLFMRYVTVWLLRVATQSDYTPDKTIQYISIVPENDHKLTFSSLPLPENQPDAFKNLPEYVLEDIVGSVNYILK